MNTTIYTFKISFKLPKDLYISRYSGRIAHGAILQFIRNMDPLLSQKLHEGNNRRDFTVTQIRIDKSIDVRIAYFTLNTHNKELMRCFLNILTNNTEATIYIIDQHCPIHQIEFKKSIISDPKKIPENTTIRIRFNSPVVFSNSNRKAKTDPYPHLEKIWLDQIKSYESIISVFTPEYKEIFIEAIRRQLSTPHFVLRSKHITMGQKIKVTAFTGTILFNVENSDNLEFLLPILELTNIWGIGGKRSLGFGEVSIEIKYPPRMKKEDNRVLEKYEINEREKTKCLKN